VPRQRFDDSGRPRDFAFGGPAWACHRGLLLDDLPSGSRDERSRGGYHHFGLTKIGSKIEMPRDRSTQLRAPRERRIETARLFKHPDRHASVLHRRSRPKQIDLSSQSPGIFRTSLVWTAQTCSEIPCPLSSPVGANAVPLARARLCHSLFVALSLFASAGAAALVTGTVVDIVSGEPIENAHVRVQTTTTAPVLTDAAGEFSIVLPGAGTFILTAVLPYDSIRPVNYITGSTSVSDGGAAQIALERLPAGDQSPYDPSIGIECATCHFDQFSAWQESRHAGAAVNLWVLDLYSGDGTPGGGNGYVFRETHDPDETGFCATCHTPLADAQNPGGEFLDEVTLAGGLDGVNCLACHQMAEVNDNTDALHHLGNTLYRFPEDPSTSLWVWGPLDDVSFGVMRASYQPGFSDSKFCASCHQYNNPNSGAPGQTTYDEWLASPFSLPGDDFRSCQDCHMPPASEPGPISSLGGQPIRPAEQRRSHAFIGSTPDTLAQAVDLELDAALVNGELSVQARVANVGAGHAFPTGVSIRNAVLVVEARVGGTALPLLEGPTVPFFGSANGGTSPEDVAGLPGRGYARVLEGRINGSGPVRFPVLFIDAGSVQSDTRIAAGETDVSEYRFGLDAARGVAPVATIEVQARLLYRRAWRDLAVTKNWTETPSGNPIEVEVQRQLLSVPLGRPAQPIPALSLWGLLLFIASILVAAATANRSRDPQPRGNHR